MSRLFRIIIILFFYSSVLAQTDNLLKNEITEKDGKVYFQDELFTGNVLDKVSGVPNDCECTYQAQYKDGLLNGLVKIWYKNGKLKERSEYKDGIILEKELYDEDGILTKKENYKAGKLESVLVVNKPVKNKQDTLSEQAKDPIGKMVEEKIDKKIPHNDEPLISTKDNLAKKQDSTTDNNDKPRTEPVDNAINKVDTGGGLQKEYYDDGEIKRVVFKRNGLIVKDSIFYPNGVLKTTKKFSDGELIHSEAYTEDGVLIKENNFINNKKNGIQIENFSNSQPKIIENYENGFLSHREVYHENGLLITEENYSYKKKNGLQKYYDDTGKLIKLQEYRMGQLIKDENYTPEGKALINVVNDLAEIKTYNKKNQLIGLKYEDVRTKAKDSLWITFDSITGNKIKEVAYVKQRKVREGRYHNNLKDGVWHYYWLNGEKETIVEYDKGNKVSEKTVTFAKLLKNNYTPGDKIYENIPGSPKIQDQLILVKKEVLSKDEYTKRILKSIDYIFDKLYDETAYAINLQDEELSAVVEFSNVECKFQPKKEGSDKVVALMNFDFQYKDYFLDRVKNRKYLFTPAEEEGESLKSYYTRDKEEAFEQTLDNLKQTVITILLKYFPVKGIIGKVSSQNSKEVKEVVVKFDKKDIREKEILNVLDEAKATGAVLKVSKKKEGNIYCKVIEGKKWLKQYMIEHKNPVVIRTFTSD